MAESLIPVNPNFAQKANVTRGTYQSWYEQSLAEPDVFWAERAKKLTWDKQWQAVKNTRFQPDVSIKWFEGGALNVSVNCIDRHLKEHADKVAIIWEADDPKEASKHITYQQLHDQVCKLTNVLTAQGVKKGDRITIYLPMIPEAAYAMLACARIGAIHSLVFGGFSADALRGRIEDCKSDFVITADEGRRGGKKVPLKKQVDVAIAELNVRKVLVIKHTGGEIQWNEKHDLWLHDEMQKASSEHKAESMDAEDPLFILYTSGSTGTPKGVLHTTAGYLLYASLTHELVFDVHQHDVYWCTADVGWVTGHSYVVYGPLCNGATTLMFEGVPNYPDSSRFWQVVDKHKVSIFYTAPTALRALMREGDDFVTRTSRKSLRVIASVGEPINPEVWMWYYKVVGDERCPVVDTWWQTETGGHMITPLPGVTDLKPGSATLPFFGIKPVLLSAEGKVIEGEGEGMLCISDSWPGQARSLYGDHARFEQTYFSNFKGYYFSGDGCKRDKQGYYWITGRVDDVINVSGHRIGTAEVESALVSHKDVAEAAVVGFPHDIKGQGIYAYVTLKSGVEETPELHKALIKHVREVIGPIASPDRLHFTPELPKTRSGKIMRRILRKIAEGEIDSIGDVSTLANPDIVKQLVQTAQKKS